MRKFILLATMLTISCDSTAYITGDELTHEGELTNQDIDMVELLILERVCPKIAQRLERPCSINLVHSIMRDAHLWWYPGGVDYRVDFVRPEEE